MVMFSRSTKPCPRHQPRVEALEERLALNVGTAASAIALQYPAAVEETNLGTVTPAVATNLGTVTPAVAVDNGSGVSSSRLSDLPAELKGLRKDPDRVVHHHLEVAY